MVVKISTKNEYGELKSIILGSVENFQWPENDKEFNEEYLDPHTTKHSHQANRQCM